MLNPLKLALVKNKASHTIHKQLHKSNVIFVNALKDVQVRIGPDKSCAKYKYDKNVNSGSVDPENTLAVTQVKIKLLYNLPNCKSKTKTPVKP